MSTLGIEALQPLSRKRFLTETYHLVQISFITYSTTYADYTLDFEGSDRILAPFSLFGIRQNPSDKNKPGSSVFSEHVCFGICSQRHSFIAALAFGAELKKENKTT